jgi:hypothetical protein
MFAQSVIEYGALASARTNLRTVLYSFGDWLSQMGMGTWLALGGLVILFLWFRRR